MITNATRLASASLLLAAGTAGAQSISNDSGGSVTFYGQVSPAYLSFNDGEETDGNVVDNAHSNTRVGFNIDQDLANDQMLRFTVETALGAPKSSEYSQDFQPDWTLEKTDIRKVELIWSGSFGAVYIGQGSMATDGISGSDLSGTSIVSSKTTSDTAGGYFFRQSNGSLSDVALGDVYDDFDGSRKGRIRYDTPAWNGITFAAAYGTDVLQDYGDKTYYDVAAYYGGEFNDVQIGAGIGYAWVEEEDETTESWAGSVSAKHAPTGINATFAYGSEIDGAKYSYGKLGWIGDVLSVGSTALSVDYYHGVDFEAVDDEETDSFQWGVQAVQTFDDQNLEAYAGYAQYSYEDQSEVSYQDANSVMAGLRWKF